MPFIDPLYTASMTDQQRAWFYAEYERARKDEMMGVLLALFLGAFGIHHFYLRRNTAGILYLIFFWTGITAILGDLVCRLLPETIPHYTTASYVSISYQ